MPEKLDFLKLLPFENQGELLWFDIETTGLSADESFLYLIGCSRIENGIPFLYQFMAEDISEEALLIQSFAELFSNETTTVHFNGSTFDIPYIERKCLSLNINSPFNNSKSIDIYKLIKPYKRLLSTDSLKQKSLERLIGINRRDIYDGGELISIYNLFLAVSRFEKLRQNNGGSVPRPALSTGLPSIDDAALGRSSHELLEILLLHNFEDVLGMLRISLLLSVYDFFHGRFTAHSAVPINTSSGAYYKLTLSPNFEIPASISYKCTPFENQGPVILTASGDTAVLYIPIYCGELKLFFPNYKDYYYLPEEDRAVHKSVGAFVDKCHRKNATANTCYERHSGFFLPMSNKMRAPCLYLCKPKCKYAYTPLDSLADEELYTYASDILSNFIM